MTPPIRQSVGWKPETDSHDELRAIRLAGGKKGREEGRKGAGICSRREAERRAKNHSIISYLSVSGRLPRRSEGMALWQRRKKGRGVEATFSYVLQIELILEAGSVKASCLIVEV